MAELVTKYQQYAEYKDSGVEWLDKVPSHWDTKPLKHLCTYNDEVLPDSTSKVFELEYVDIGSVSSTEGITNTENMVFENAPSRAKRIVRDGDVIVSTVRTYLEAIAPINNPPENMIVSTGFAVIRPNKYLCKGYAAYCLRAKGFIKEVVSLSVGVSYPAINATDLVGIKIPSLPFKEQTQIANFLDNETAQIDTLIEKQQTLIQLLKEKRQAVISHAVTKGLNPDAPMKDSGVEWLGSVPEHWSFATVRRYLLEHRQGYYTSDSYVDDGTKLLRITDLREMGEIDIKECPMVSRTQSLKNYLLKEGDVVFARTGGAGSFGVIPKLEEDVAYASYLIRFRFLPKFFDTEYLRFMLIADSFQLAVKSNIHGGVTQNIHAEDIKNTFVASPPLKEQNKISSYLIAQTNSYANLIKKAESAIQLMQERRTALISAAVTGKIDVRGWVAPDV